MPAAIILALLLCASLHAAETLSPLDPARMAELVAKDAVVVEKRVAWYRKIYRETYEKIGARDPRWDEQVFLLLEVCANRDGGRNDLGANEAAMMSQAADDAVKNGCSDPLIRFIQARTTPVMEPNTELAMGRRIQAVKPLKETAYHPLIRCSALLEAARSVFKARSADALREKQQALIKSNTMPREELLKALDEMEVARSEIKLHPAEQEEVDGFLAAAIALLPQVAADAEVPPLARYTLAAELANVMRTASTDVGAAQARAEKLLAETYPGSALPLVVKAKYNVVLAWQARGTGFANTVTPEGWAAFGEHMKTARESFEAAWAIDPQNNSIARDMFSLLGATSGTSAELDLWFRRALETNPNNNRIVRSRMNFLEPKWGGSIEEMIAFGKECAASGNDFQVFALVDAHNRIATLLKKSDPASYKAYFARPEVWRDMSGVYKPYLKKYPDDLGKIGEFTNICLYADKYKEAHAQFQALGDRMHSNMKARYFKDDLNFEKLKKTAAEKAAQQKEEGF